MGSAPAFPEPDMRRLGASEPSALKSEALHRVLRDLDRVVVAFSGGADSALLAHAAHTLLGPDRVHVVTAVSPSLAGDERADAAALATSGACVGRPLRPTR